MDTVKKYSYQIAIGAIAVVLVLVIVLIWNSSQYNKLFYSTFEGMWIAPETFCMQSGIDGMMLYIGPDLGGFHKAYLLMYSNNAVAVAKAIEIHFSRSMPNLVFKDQIIKKAIIKPQDPEESSEDIMPENQTITLDLSSGKMEWTAWDDDAGDLRKYAEFYRDNISSSGANEPDE